MEPGEPPSPSVFLSLPVTPHGDGWPGPRLHLALVDEDIVDELLYQLPDHPTLLQAERPFTQILSSTASFDAQQPAPPGMPATALLRGQGSITRTAARAPKFQPPSRVARTPWSPAQLVFRRGRGRTRRSNGESTGRRRRLGAARCEDRVELPQNYMQWQARGTNGRGD